ncbi:signal recognition particle receptor subunit beta-like [Penaeus japonicus]|uniref:signal recognition particle receptor subunit beta-like n=1 Tax=Penaeus japonicus TaxID=27405 RepID=UPI001C70D5B6|nr:signal recognition particle receptor subunit beta-like [Penaeus japonicus]
MATEGAKGKKVIKLGDMMANMPKLDEFQIKILVAVLVGLLTLYILFRLFRSGSKRHGVLLMGLCESGKTQLFSWICHGADVTTVTSMKPSNAEYKIGKKSLTVYDVPGHERIRYAAFEKIKNIAGGIAFLVDSATIQKDVRDVAEFLYTVMCDETIQNGRPRILIVCNKQDLPLARSAQLICKMMEKEMNLLRETRSSQLQSTSGTGNNNSFLGHPGQDFEFGHLGGIKVDFVEAVTKGGEKINPITSWLEGLA